MNLGLLLISKRVLMRMYASEKFACEVGRALRQHGLDQAPRAAALKHGVRLVSQFAEFGVVTLHDKNGNPRTSVVLDDEGCFS